VTAPDRSIPIAAVLMMASKRSMPNIPRLEIVNVPPVISSRVNVPPRARRASSRVSAPIWAGDLDSAAAHDGRHEAVVGSHRNADVRPRIGQHSSPRRCEFMIGIPDQGERGGAHQ